jgi:hypothetical protein
MTLQPQQRVFLRDQAEVRLGHVDIDEVQDNLIYGRFTATPGFVRVQQLFEDYQQAVNQQLFSLVDDLEDRMANMGLQLESLNGSPMPPIHNVQIGSGRITFRVSVPAERAENGPEPSIPFTTRAGRGSELRSA